MNYELSIKGDTFEPIQCHTKILKPYFCIFLCFESLSLTTAVDIIIYTGSRYLNVATQDFGELSEGSRDLPGSSTVG